MPVCLEGRSLACYVNDQGEEAIAARQAAFNIWRSLGDPLKEGENLRWLSHFYWLEGRGVEAEASAMSALEVLEPLGPGPELAMAYSNLAQLRMLDHDLDGTLHWGNRAIALAEQFGVSEILIHALTNIGTAHHYGGDDRGHEELTRSIDLALADGLIDDAIRALNNLAWMTLLTMRLDEAEQRFSSAITYAIEHDLDTYHWYLLAGRATLRVRQGTWDAAELEIRQLLQQPMVSSVTRSVALTTMGQLYARRGNSEASATLDEALLLADRNGQLIRLWPARAARAEAALLRGDRERARDEVMAVRDAIFARGNQWHRGELAWLLWQAGDRDVPTDNLAKPYALQIAGDFAAAAAAWSELGCPYDEAWALVESNDPVLVRRGAASFEELRAQPALRHAIRRLRALGVRDPRPLQLEPRAATRASSHGLTARELEVLRLLAAGHSNRELGEKLFISPTTAARHVANIYSKLGVDSRAAAIAYAYHHGLI